MTVVAALHPLSGLAQLHVGAVFFYEALWSILLGVSVTAAIDVFVDKEAMARVLGRRVALTVTSMSTYQTAFWFSVAYAVLGVLVSFRLAPSRTRC